MAGLVGEPATAPANERVWAHLAGCAECRELLSALVKCNALPVADGVRDRTYEAEPPTARTGAGAAAGGASWSGTRRGLAAGTILHDTYRVERLIGQGGMGSVHVATHLRLPKRVAIKVLRTSVLVDSEAYARFKREAEISSAIGHPNIVEVHDFNVTAEGDPYFVMELLEGEDLAQSLARGHPLSLPRTLEIAGGIAHALTAAHARGIVHRDLKPQNVFVNVRGGPEVVKVLDFGISKIVGLTDIGTRSSSLIGTPAYMSPEQARGRSADADARADQFALAAIVYEMLSGQRAFARAGDDLWAILTRIISEHPAPIEGLPAPVWRVLGRALAKRADDRFADVASFMAALGEAAGVSTDPVAATPLPVTSTAERGAVTAEPPTTPPFNGALLRRSPAHERRRSLTLLLVGGGAVAAVGALFLVPAAAPRRAPEMAPTTPRAQPPPLPTVDLGAAASASDPHAASASDPHAASAHPAPATAPPAAPAATVGPTRAAPHKAPRPGTPAAKKAPANGSGYHLEDPFAQ